MLEIIRGANKKDNSTAQLIESLQKAFNSPEKQGLIYIGYPILSTTIGGVILDAVLVTESHGMIVFDLIEDTSCGNRSITRDLIFSNTKSRLIQHPDLMNGRELGVSLEVITYAPQVKTPPESSIDFTNSNSSLLERLNEIKDEKKNSKYIKNLISVVQAVTKLSNPRKRHAVKSDSRGAKLRNIEASIANLDSRQNRAVIETVEGPQRIRGLAGSGKTIILALKAAYLHSRYPEWDIAITFNTRSLKDQFTDFVTKFTIEQKHEDPDWTKIKIVQSWGSYTSMGIYYDFCISNSIEPLDFRTARSRASSGITPLGFACKDALEQIKNRKVEPRQKYDVILIDEAQDLSPYFLRLCYAFLKSPKRIIWAYDELQNLSMMKMKSPRDLFGIDLSNEPDEAQKDIILDRCYRNSRPILVTAHGLGFGIAREKGGLVQMFDEPSLWKEIGYEIESGKLLQNEKVTLYRPPSTSPLFLETHSTLDDLIQFKVFENIEKQADWVASEISKNLKEDELTTRDIIVVTLNPLSAENDTAALRYKLLKLGINNHIAGLTTSPDKFFKEDSIVITGIYRAKGNEAAMVYVINSEYSFSGSELSRKRNMLFSAITRSKAWVRVTGCGQNMTMLTKEFEEIKNLDFKLSFKYPTPKEMEEMRVINRDLTESEKRKRKKIDEELQKLVDNLNQGIVTSEEIDPKVKKQLTMFFSDKQDE